MGLGLLIVFALLGVCLWRIHALQSRLDAVDATLRRLSAGAPRASATSLFAPHPADPHQLGEADPTIAEDAANDAAGDLSSGAATGAATDAATGGSQPPPNAASGEAAEPVSTGPHATGLVPRAAPHVPATRAPGSAPPTPPQSKAERRAAKRASVEAFVGGKLLLLAGVVTVLFGLAFFLKFAFDRELIGPTARVLLGIAVGIAAIVGGDVLHRRNLRWFAQGLMGLGLGSLYLSVFFAATRYELIGQYTAFGCTALITASGVVLALWRDGPVLAWLGFLGGLLAPLLLGTDTDSLEELAVWLVLIDVGLLIVLWRRSWSGLELVSIGFSALYLSSWYEVHSSVARLAVASTVLSVRVLALLALCLLPPILTGRTLRWTALLGAVATGVLGVTAGHELALPAHELPLAGAVTFLALLYLGAGWMLSTHPAAGEREGDVLYAVGLGGLAAVVPLVAAGRVVAPTWAAAGAACVYASTLRRRAVFAWCGLVMCALAIVNLGFELPMHRGSFLPFANGDFLAYVFPFLALAAAGWMLANLPEPAARGRGRAGRLMILAAAWLAIPLVPAEIIWHLDIDGARYAGDESELIWGLTALGAAGYAAALAWCGRSASRAVRAAPVGPLVAAILWALLLGSFGHEHAFTPFANVIFVGGAAVVGAGALICANGRSVVRGVFAPAVALLALYLLTAEIYRHADLVAGSSDERRAAAHAAQVWISIAWTLSGAAAIALGFARRRRTYRLAGIAVFVLTLAKVFLVDLALLETVYRIGSFLVLGILLVGASFLYQRFSSALSERVAEDDGATVSDDASS